MYFVYILRSIKYPTQIYTGSTENIQQRLKQHNNKSNKHTSKFAPWKIIWFCVFPAEKQAKEFEKYLKSASGIAFKRKRLM